MERGCSKNVFVKRDNEENVEIRFSFSPVSKEERHFCFSRLNNEEVGVTLRRIGLNIVGKFNKKTKKKKNENLADYEIENVNVKLLDCDSNPVEDNVTNHEAWIDGYVLCISEEKYTVVVNAPSVASLRLPFYMMAEFPVIPIATFDHAEEIQSLFFWFVDREPDDSVAGVGSEDASVRQYLDLIERKFPHQGKAISAGGGEQGQKPKWYFVSKAQTFTPNVQDNGATVRVVCFPRGGDVEGVPAQAVSPGQVGAGPGPCLCDVRHLYTQREAHPPSFRVVSYNILADLYAKTDFSRQHLYPYCAPYALHTDYRTQLIIKELKGYHADIICLQEVDRKVYESELSPVLSLFGFKAALLTTKPSIPEGCATFYRNSKFELVESIGFPLCEELQSDPGLSVVRNQLNDESPAFFKYLLSRRTIGQIHVLRPKGSGNNLIFVATTHLYWKPTGGHIRILQMLSLLNRLQKIVSEYRQENPHIIVCGDLNSLPEQGVCTLMINQKVKPDFSEWHLEVDTAPLNTEVSDSESGDEEAEAPVLKNGLSISQPYSFYSACGFPAYTNFVPGFRGTLDWCYVTSNITVDQIIPMPEHEDVTQHIALPSVIAPSDHLALVCDLKLT